jgi:hypothetical protein
VVPVQLPVQLPPQVSFSGGFFRLVGWFVGLGWMDWIGLDGLEGLDGLDGAGLDGAGLRWLDWIGLVLIGLNWAGLTLVFDRCLRRLLSCLI